MRKRYIDWSYTITIIIVYSHIIAKLHNIQKPRGVNYFCTNCGCSCQEIFPLSSYFSASISTSLEVHASTMISKFLQFCSCNIPDRLHFCIPITYQIDSDSSDCIIILAEARTGWRKSDSCIFVFFDPSPPLLYAMPFCPFLISHCYIATKCIVKLLWGGEGGNTLMGALYTTPPPPRQKVGIWSHFTKKYVPD